PARVVTRIAPEVNGDTRAPALADGAAQEHADELGRRGQRVLLGDALDVGDAAPDHARRDVVHDRRLGVVVAVDRAGGQPGLRNDLGHRRRGEALAPEHAQGGLRDLVAAARAVLLADPGHAPTLNRTDVLDSGLARVDLKRTNIRFRRPP